MHNDGSLNYEHAIRHNIVTAFAWVMMHLPLVASMLAGGHVAAASTKTDELEDPELWLLCGGLGIGIICLYVIAMLHRSDDPPGTLMLPKVGVFRATETKFADLAISISAYFFVPL